MKMRNDDIKKITEIKQYLLDPPVSFKLYDYAATYLNDAVNILSRYPEAKDITDYLRNLAQQFQAKQIDQADLGSTLKEAAITISKLTRQ